MAVIDVKTVEKAVYNLCLKANVCLDEKIYSKIYTAYNSGSSNKNILAYILKNARIAFETKKPICQDTGQVLLFLSLGQNLSISGGDLYESINKAVEKCYLDNFFRKSVVKDALFDRANTNTNIPAIIYTDIIPGDELKIDVLLKGAGSENKSKSQMLLPTASKEEIKKFIAECVLSSGVNSCPPLFVGVGIGGTIDKASVLAKKALIEENFEKENKIFAQEIKEYINSQANNEFGTDYVLDLKLLTSSTHIACMPVAVNINCHASRKASCIIKNGEIAYFNNTCPEFKDIDLAKNAQTCLNTSDIDAIKSLKTGEEVFLSGEIYIARDAAHKRLSDLLKNNQPLPVDMKNKIIFYAGPCPAKPGEPIGAVGPTTSSRMDNYAPELYDLGVIATIGKGDRGSAVVDSIKKNNAVYFTVIGGIASYLADKVVSSEIIAFEDLGAEAVYKITVKDFPVKVEIGR